MPSSGARELIPWLLRNPILGRVTQGGEQSSHIGRGVVLASRLPTSVPAVTIDRQCGSSQQAVHFGAQAVMSGTQDVVIAAGVESMTRVPMGSAPILLDQAGLGKPKSPARRRAIRASFQQFVGADVGENTGSIATRWITSHCGAISVLLPRLHAAPLPRRSCR